MSESQVDDRIDDDDAPRSGDVEREARLQGWKPKDEFTGPADKWVPADKFVALSRDRPAVMADRNRVLIARLDQLERESHRTRLDLTGKLDAAVETVNELTKMTRTAEQRAYERARRELGAKIETAVESGDKQMFAALERERAELEAAKPPPEPVRAQPTTPAAPPIDPAIMRFFSENPWYDKTGQNPNRDPEMMAFADMIHTGLLNTNPNLPMAENLDVVRRELRHRFPEKFDRPTRPRAEELEDREPGAPAVSPSSGGAPRRQANRRTFDTMPKESRDAYDRYAKMLAGKGEPLTKAEWATEYWAQFPEDGT